MKITRILLQMPDMIVEQKVANAKDIANPQIILNTHNY